MKNVILIIIVLRLSTFTSTAQVITSFFEEKNAFESFPALKQSRSQDLATKRMPQVDTEKLWAEDRNTEGLDIPFRCKNMKITT